MRADAADRPERDSIVAMRTSSPTRRRVAAALSLTALLLAGSACGVDGDDDASPTTTGPGTETSTPAELGDLSDLLPSEQDLPDGYLLQPAEAPAPSSQLGDELEDACPEAARIRAIIDRGDEDDDAGDEGAVARTFATEQKQEIEVEIRPANPRDVPVDDFIDAISSCSTIETETNGRPATIELSAAPLDLGDDAMRLTMDMVITVGTDDVDITFEGFLFRRNGVAVEVTASSGVLDDYRTVPGDPDVAEQLAADIDQAIQER